MVFAVSAIIALFPAVSFAQMATSTDPSATSTDFSNFVGLQMPQGLPFDDTAVNGVSGVSPDGLMTFIPAPQYPNGPRLIKLDGSNTIYWVSPNNIKIAILTRAVFLSYNNKDSDVQTVDQAEFDYYSAAKYIRLNGTGVIFKIEGNKKRAIPSAIWNPAGIDVSQIIDVNKTELSSYLTGSKLTSSDELN